MNNQEHSGYQQPLYKGRYNPNFTPQRNMRRAGASALKEAARLQRIKAEKKKKRRVVMAIVGGITVAVLIIVIVIVNIAKTVAKIPTTIAPSTVPKFPPLTDEEMSRINCYPEQDGALTDPWFVNKEICKARGCEYWPHSRNPYAPVCYMSASKIAYRKVDMRRYEDGKTDFTLHRVQQNHGVFANTSLQIIMSFIDIANQILRIRITEHVRLDSSGKATNLFTPIYDFAKNESLIRPRPLSGVTYNEDNQPLLNYKVEVVRDEPFTVKVLRAKEGYTYGSPIWSNELGGLIINENFTQVTTTLPRGSRVYGLGEHRHTKFRRGIIHGTWALFARNQPPDWRLDSNLYGAHPFLLVVDPSGFAHGILFYNSAPAEISVTPYPAVIWRTTGGIPDIFIFTGPTPDGVITQYTQIVGRTMMPPRWFLGLHVCFSGAHNLSELAEMRRRFDATGLPWSILCLRNNVDEELLTPELADVAQSKKISLTFSAMAPPNAAHNRNLPPIGRTIPFVYGGDLKVDIKKGQKPRLYRQPYSVTKYKNGSTNTYFFWDPLEDDVSQYLARYLQQKRKTVPFDILDLDDNQPYINYAEDNVTVASCLDVPMPYVTKGGYLRTMRTKQAFYNYTTATLSQATLCMSARHRDFSVRHLDIHNAYGFMFSKAVHEGWFKMINETDPASLQNRRVRFPIMSSSTFPGSGRFTGHWIGRTFASWQSLPASVMGVLEMNWFGIPLVGDTICGEEGPGNLEMCTYWATLTAFYPVVRLDYSPNGRHRFMALLNNPTFLSIFHRSLTFRAHLFPYLFSTFYESSVSGLPVWKPLFHLFAADRNLADEYHTFMMGDGLLVAPILTQAAGDYQSVQLVPGFRWFHLRTSQEFNFCPKNADALTSDHKIDAKIMRRRSKTHRHGSVDVEGPENFVYLRGGSIVPIMSEVISIIDPFNPLSEDESERLEVPYQWPSFANVTVAEPLHISLLVSCDCLVNKRDRLARGSFYWEGGVNDSANVYIKLVLTKDYLLETNKMAFNPIRRAENSPGAPWEFEVIIDHILFYGINVTRFFPRNLPTTTVNPRHHAINILHDDLPLHDFPFGATTTESTTTTTTESTTTTTTTPTGSTASTTPTMENSEVKLIIRQTVAGDKMLTATRHASAFFDWRRQMLVARNISITVSDGDFTVSLQRPQTHQQSTTPSDLS